MDNKKILAVITARGGSKGIPGKNIKDLGGKPLIAYTIKVAKDSKLITDLIVSTDDKEIADVCREYKADVPFIRPAELASDTANHVDVMQHAVNFMENKLGIKFDYIIVLQPTSPFRKAEDIDLTIQKLIDYPEADSAVSMTEIEDNHPIKIKKMEGDFVLPYCIAEPEKGRRQDFPKAYKRSGAVYVMKRKILMEDGEIFGKRIVGHIVPKERSIDIDTPLHWIQTEYMLEKLKEKGDFS